MIEDALRSAILRRFKPTIVLGCSSTRVIAGPKRPGKNSRETFKQRGERKHMFEPVTLAPSSYNK